MTTDRPQDKTVPVPSVRSGLADLTLLIFLLPLLAAFVLQPNWALGYPGQNYNELRVLQLLTFALLALAAWRLDLRLPSGPATVLLLAALACGLLSATLGTAPAAGLQEVALTSALVLSALVMTHCLRTSRYRDAWLLTLVLLPLMPSLHLLVELTMHFPPQAWNLSFNNIRVYDDTLLPLILLAMGVLERRVSARLATLLPALYLFGLLMDNSRAGLLGYLVALTTLWLLPAPALAGRALRALLLALAAWLLTQALLGEWQETLVRTDSSQRIETYVISFRHWLGHIWLGVGPGSFNHLADGITASHPHNIIWQWLYEWGLIGGLLLVGFCLRLLNQLHAARQSLDAATLAALSAFMANSLLGGAMIYPTSQLVLVILAANLFAALPPASTPARGPHVGWCLALAVLVVVAIQQAQIRNVIFAPSWLDQPGGPRFWARGANL